MARIVSAVTDTLVKASAAFRVVKPRCGGQTSFGVRTPSRIRPKK